MTCLLKIRVALVACLALGPITTSFAGELAEADKAKALIALSKAKGGRTATAPAPKDYPAGYKAATADQVPLVVFVGCDVVPVVGSVACKCDAPSFGEAKAPSVVVGYPVGEKLMIDTTIPGQGTETEVKKAVEKAARKIGDVPARPMPAPAPADWQIRAEEGSDEQPISFRRGRAACACGDKCPCAEAPTAKVETQPVAPKPVEAPAPVISYQLVTYRDNRGRTWSQLEPIGSPAVSCSGGTCSPATSYSFPGVTYSSGSSCANGRCPTSR